MEEGYEKGGMDRSCVHFVGAYTTYSSLIRTFSRRREEYSIYHSLWTGWRDGSLSRSFLPFLKQYLPWKKGEIVPENQDAAAGITGSGLIYFSKPDGYTIGIVFTRSLVVPQILGQVAKFDIAKFTYLGQFVNEPSVVFTSAKHPFSEIIFRPKECSEAR